MHHIYAQLSDLMDCIIFYLYQILIQLQVEVAIIFFPFTMQIICY